MANFPWGEQVNRWVGKRALASLEQAYQAAIAIKAIEDKHFNGQKITAQNDQGISIYNYFKTDLDQALLKTRWYLTQFQASNFWLSSQQQAKPEAEILNKLGEIEAIIGKYRSEPEAIETEIFPLSTAHSGESLPESKLTDLEEESRGKNRLFKLNRELTPAYEQEVIQRLRNLRQQKKIAIRFLILLILVPLLVQVATKNLIYSPLINYFRVEVAKGEKLYIQDELVEQYFEEFSRYKEILEIKELLGLGKPESPEETRKKLKAKAQELLTEVATKSQEGFKNILADLTSLGAFTLLIYLFRRQFTIARQFLGRYFLGLSDVTKVFIFILLTDTFVGFHSAHGWEVILESIFGHLGLPENRQFIFLFIATVPVILDSTFKLLIFNYFTRQSPSSVAILEKMQK
jgi:hypothetical protein